MNFQYTYGAYPNRNPARAKVKQAAERLFNRLSTLDIKNLDISDYNKRYFGSHIATEDILRGHITKYGYILEWALSEIDENIEKVTLLDYLITTHPKPSFRSFSGIGGVLKAT